MLKLRLITLQDCIAHSAYRDSLLVNLWQAYNAVSETAVKVAFKSSILDMAQLREDQAAELTTMREALTQTQGNASKLERTLALIAGALATCASAPATAMQRRHRNGSVPQHIDTAISVSQLPLQTQTT